MIYKNDVCMDTGADTAGYSWPPQHRIHLCHWGLALPTGEFIQGTNVILRLYANDVEHVLPYCSRIHGRNTIRGIIMGVTKAAMEFC